MEDVHLITPNGTAQNSFNLRTSWWKSTLARVYAQSCFALVLQELNTSDCTSFEAFWKAARWSWGNQLQQSSELITSPCVPSIHPWAPAFSCFSVLCFSHIFKREESAPEEKGWKEGFYNLSSSVLSMGSCLLDYATEAPALNLISFNICQRFLS